MLIFMNALIFLVFICGWGFAKSAWSDKKYIKAIGIMLVNVIVCFILIMMKESMKADVRKSVLGCLFM